jgi:hypothetical protein
MRSALPIRAGPNRPQFLAGFFWSQTFSQCPLRPGHSGRDFFLYAGAAASGEFTERCQRKGQTKRGIPLSPPSSFDRFLSLSRSSSPLPLRFDWLAAIFYLVIFEISLSIGGRAGQAAATSAINRAKSVQAAAETQTWRRWGTCGCRILRSAIWRSGYARQAISDPTRLLELNADIVTPESDDVCFVPIGDQVRLRR